MNPFQHAKFYSLHKYYKGRKVLLHFTSKLIQYFFFSFNLAQFQFNFYVEFFNFIQMKVILSIKHVSIRSQYIKLCLGSILSNQRKSLFFPKVNHSKLEIVDLVLVSSPQVHNQLISSQETKN